MRLSGIQDGALNHIIENMREWDRREIFATKFYGMEAEQLHEAVINTGPVSWIAYHQLEPIAVFGCAPMWPGVWSMWFFATDNIHKIGLGVTRLIIRYIVPMLWDGGAHRLECRSMEGHVEAQRWLDTLGARREATLLKYGRQGEDFHVYTWEKPNVLLG
jgi:hypothetical protein